MMSTTAAAPTLMSALRSREKVAHGTMAFRFEKPPGWVFKAGQFLDITLVDPPETDAEGNIRSFSIASGPHEDTLMIATRMRDSAFKRVLKSMPIGTAVKIEGPSGDLTLHQDSARPAVFLAGGIGITPFRSILLQAAREKLPHRLFLFYSNHGPEDAPFLEELEALEQQNPRYTMIPSMSDMSMSSRPWSGEVGLIDRAMLSRHVKDAVSPIYYVAGPPKLVTAMQAMLKAQSVADADVRAEAFSGY
jgi:ferredoxin-NADP reductase